MPFSGRWKSFRGALYGKGFDAKTDKDQVRAVPVIEQAGWKGAVILCFAGNKNLHPLR